MDYRHEPEEEPGDIRGERREGMPGDRREDAWRDTGEDPTQEPRHDPWGEADERMPAEREERLADEPVETWRGPKESRKREDVEGARRERFQGKVYVSDSRSGVTARPAKHYVGKAIVSIQEGRKIGSVADIVIDGDTLQVAAIITSKGTLFNRELEAILAEEIKVWGEDVILVAMPDVIRHENQIEGRERWLNLNDSIRGRYVVSVDGTRVGQIGDVIIDTNGRLTGYELSQVFIEGPVADHKKISADATHSLGKDVLVVNTLQALSYPDDKEERGTVRDNKE
jgi:uncharacterized protein YrrD